MAGLTHSQKPFALNLRFSPTPALTAEKQWPSLRQSGLLSHTLLPTVCPFFPRTGNTALNERAPLTGHGWERESESRMGPASTCLDPATWPAWSSHWPHGHGRTKETHLRSEPGISPHVTYIVPLKARIILEVGKEQ